MFGSNDRAHMRAALALAARGLGRVAPNPTVGCILVREDLGENGLVVGRGWTQPGGRPHAETEALTQAGNLALGSHAYVTLEPCNHQGQTGPCSEALINAGVATVTIALEDPDPRVSGTGSRRLVDAEIDVRTGLLGDEARRLNAGFLSVIERGRPWVTFKTATTLDGAIAARTGKSKWITGAAARNRGHLFRAENDAILTGIGTVRNDDPTLTCRLAGLEDRSPIRVIVDPRAETPLDSQLFKSVDVVPVWLIIGDGAPEENIQLRQNTGAKMITLPTVSGGRLAPQDIVKALAGEGITRVLLETGSALSGSFMSDDLVDELAWFRAPSVMGGDSLPAIAPMAVNTPDNATRFQHLETIPLDGDRLERYLRMNDKG